MANKGHENRCSVRGCCVSIVSIARVQLRAARFLLPFLWRSLHLAYSARNAPGNLGVRLRRSKGLVFWRVTLWVDKHSMEEFRNGDLHKDVEPKARLWFDEFSIASFQQEGKEIPSWTDAPLLLKKYGRMCEVDRPSKSQMSGEIDIS